MIKRLIIIILLLSVHVSALDLGHFSIRGSGAIFWNEGWQDKFYFKTYTQSEWEEVLNGKQPDFNRTLRHEMIINPELWWSTSISSDFDLAISLKYESFQIDLKDSVNFSWIRWLKGLSADLDFYSIGARLIWAGPIQPYLGGGIGYCHGNLTTRHILDPPDNTEYSIWIDGDGGGIFYSFVGGCIFPLFDRLGLFMETGFRFSTEWDEFGVDQVYGDASDKIEWLYEDDRHLDRIFGWHISIGVQVGIR